MNDPEYDTIPEELKSRDQWLLWDNRADRPKQPHWDGDHSISWSNPDDWHSFAEAKELAEENGHWGIGYVTAKENDDYPRGLYWVIDIDGGVTENGEIKDWVPDLARFTDALTYIERSPSGTGLHIPVVGYDIPEWWSDSQLDGHEGVDVLANKFCTFTGDTIEESGNQVADVDPTAWLYKAYDALNSEAPSYDPDDSTEYNGPGLSEEQVAEALDHIDPDLPYQDWLRVGMALYDWDDGSRGKRQFEQWSKSNPKWEKSRGQPHIDDIWENDSPNGDVTVGTLIYHAKQGGWEPPTGYSEDGSEDFDPDEVERGEALLKTETGPENPPGELQYKNGGYGYEEVYTDEDGNVTNRIWGEICNFRLETLSYLSTDRGEQIKLRVIPKNPREDPYEVRVEPAVFNSPQAFKEEVVVGRTTWFDSSNPKSIPTQTTLGYLRELVGSQPAPNRVGTEFIGLSPDREEWVTPSGSIGEDGWIEDPEFEFYSKGGGDDDGGLANKWQLDPDDQTEYDETEVREICELLPRIRKKERGIPILGWFYAAPLKPYIHDDFGEGEFNLLQVHADSGAGKTATIQAFWQAFGADPNPFSASDTAFTIEKHMTESAGLPVWYDEFKPTDMADYKLKRLRDTFRKLTRESTLSKGTADLDEITFQLRAPVIVSGEQQFNDTAVRRRTVMTNLSTAATKPASEYAEAFGELTGASYEAGDGTETYPEGHELDQHARAYYEYVAGLDKQTLHKKWRDAREQVTELLSQMGVSTDDSEQQGLQTVAFGTKVYREFAQLHGVQKESLPTEADVANAIAHVVENIGKDGNRREHADDFMELLTGAAREDYIEEGVHYRVINSTKQNQEVLAVHMPSSFTGIKKYLREFNLEDEYQILSRDDYLTSFGNKAEQDGSYVFDTNKKTRNLDNGSKAVHFDPWRAEEKLGGGFQMGAFTDVEREDEEDGRPDDDEPSGTAIMELSPGAYQGFKATVASDVDPKPWLEAEGTLEDASGIIDYVARGSDPGLEEGVTYKIERARVTEGENGMPQVEIRDGVTQIESLEPSASQSQLSQSQAATDGGADNVQAKRIREIKRVVSDLETTDSAPTKEKIVIEMSSNGFDAEKVKNTISNLKNKGVLFDSDGGIRASDD